VFITQYPVGIFDDIARGAKPCGVLGSSFPNPATGTDLEGLDLDEADARDFAEVGALLNQKIREKADEFGWHLVDGIPGAFEGHEYCSARPYFVSAEESCLRQSDFEGMLHPNANGHRVTRDRIAAVMSKELVHRTLWLEAALHALTPEPV
jgi:hypothetical protein